MTMDYREDRQSRIQQRLDRLSDAEFFEPGDIVRSGHRWGKVSHVTRDGYVVVTLYNERLGRYVYGTTSYSPGRLQLLLVEPL